MATAANDTTAKKPSVMQLVLKAISTVGDRKKGASYAAIRKYVKDTGFYDDSKLTYLMKTAIEKGLKSGQLIRAKNSLEKTGCVGYFMIPKKDLKTPVKKKPGEALSDSETAVRPRLPTDNLSDSEVYVEKKAKTRAKEQKTNESNALKKDKTAKKLFSDKPQGTKKNKDVEKLPSRQRSKKDAVEDSDNLTANADSKGAGKSEKNIKPKKPEATGAVPKKRGPPRQRGQAEDLPVETDKPNSDNEEPASEIAIKSKKRTAPLKKKQAKDKQYIDEEQSEEPLEEPAAETVAKKRGAARKGSRADIQNDEIEPNPAPAEDHGNETYVVTKSRAAAKKKRKNANVSENDKTELDTSPLEEDVNEAAPVSKRGTAKKKGDKPKETDTGSAPSEGTKAATTKTLRKQRNIDVSINTTYNVNDLPKAASDESLGSEEPNTMSPQSSENLDNLSSDIRGNSDIETNTQADSSTFNKSYSSDTELQQPKVKPRGRPKRQK